MNTEVRTGLSIPHAPDRRTPYLDCVVTFVVKDHLVLLALRGSVACLRNPNFHNGYFGARIVVLGRHPGGSRRTHLDKMIQENSHCYLQQNLVQKNTMSLLDYCVFDFTRLTQQQICFVSTQLTQKMNEKTYTIPE